MKRLAWCSMVAGLATLFHCGGTSDVVVSGGDDAGPDGTALEAGGGSDAAGAKDGTAGGKDGLSSGGDASSSGAGEGGGGNEGAAVPTAAVTRPAPKLEAETAALATADRRTVAPATQRRRRAETAAGTPGRKAARRPAAGMRAAETAVATPGRMRARSTRATGVRRAKRSSASERS